MAACETKDLQQQLAQTEALLKSIQEGIDYNSRPLHPAQRTLQKFRPIARGETGGFKSLGHFLKSVQEVCQGTPVLQHEHMGPYVKGLGVRHKSTPAGMSETVGADGGFLIPPEFSAQILMRTYANDLLSRTTMLPISGNNIRVPAVSEKSRADGSRFGGVQAFWRAEAGSPNATKPSLELVNLQLEALTVFIRMTDELLQDGGAAVETYVETVASAELEFVIGNSLVNGSGVNQPQGIFNSPSKIAQAKDSGQTAGTVTVSNLSNMWSRLHVSCMPGAVWLIDQSVYPQLFQLTLGNYPVFLPPGGLSASPYGLILGKPVIPVEFCQPLGTEGDIILTDLSTVLSAAKAGIQSAASMHVYFLSSEQVFRWTIRLDARSWWFSALTPKSGGATQSNVVTLATRS